MNNKHRVIKNKIILFFISFAVIFFILQLFINVYNSKIENYNKLYNEISKANKDISSSLLFAHHISQQYETENSQRLLRKSINRYQVMLNLVTQEGEVAVEQESISLPGNTPEFRLNLDLIAPIWNTYKTNALTLASRVQFDYNQYNKLSPAQAVLDFWAAQQKIINDSIATQGINELLNAKDTIAAIDALALKLAKKYKLTLNKDYSLDSISTKAYKALQQNIDPLSKQTNELLDSCESIVNNTQATLQLLLYINWGMFFLFLALGYLVYNTWIAIPIQKINNSAALIQTGDLDQRIDYKKQNEIGIIADTLNLLIGKIRQATTFIKGIEQGELDLSYEAEEKDTLSEALLNMREKLSAVNIEEQERAWANKGLAMFSNILQTYRENTQTLGYEIISNIVKYIDANQGGIYIVNDNDEQNIFIELLASYAFGKQKYRIQQINTNEGLVGQAYNDVDTIYVTDIPNDYVDISSGMGGANPSCILVIPLKLNETVYGVMELASFEEIPRYKIDFLEKLGENIASTLYAVKTTEQTHKLLLESTEITRQMRDQEKEMRDNLLTLQHTQGEMEENQEVLTAQSYAMNTTLITLEMDIEFKILNANELFLETMNYSAAEITGKHYRMFIDTEDFESDDYKALWNDLKNGVPHKGEFKQIAKYGKEVWLQTTFTPIKNKEGKTYKILKIAFDVTTDKKLRLDFQGQLESFRRSNATVEYDMDGNILEANDIFLRLMEYKRDDIIGQNHAVLVTNEERNSEAYQLLWDKLVQGEYHSGESRRVSKNGKEIWIQGSFNPIFDLSGKPYKLVEFAVDITDRKNAERKILLTQRKLQNREANLKAVINNTEEMILTVDQSYKITLLNDKMRAAYATRNITLKAGLNITETFQEDKFNYWKQHYDKTLEGEKIQIEEIFNHPENNQDIYWQFSFIPIKNKLRKITGVAVFIKDITKQKQEAFEKEKIAINIASIKEQETAKAQEILETQQKSIARIIEKFEKEKADLQEALKAKEQELEMLRKK
ncbi:PAS domain S-box protein [Microscilla marina]|uniref:Chemotaxis protein n=1 Tax=Microscilla marina ATCC 23134 TaxID=313606 RepID=A1ZMX7_MICM2|nr:PAS domain S-box protein [Microscilla marina]EAY28158.1 chemotaxis protein [Microscilla marina ATCC 23134]